MDGASCLLCSPGQTRCWCCENMRGWLSPCQTPSSLPPSPLSLHPSAGSPGCDGDGKVELFALAPHRRRELPLAGGQQWTGAGSATHDWWQEARRLQFSRVLISLHLLTAAGGAAGAGSAGRLCPGGRVHRSRHQRGCGVRPGPCHSRHPRARHTRWGWAVGWVLRKGGNRQAGRQADWYRYRGGGWHVGAGMLIPRVRLCCIALSRQPISAGCRPHS